MAMVLDSSAQGRAHDRLGGDRDYKVSKRMQIGTLKDEVSTGAEAETKC